jgi:hypothetical protein
MGINVYVCDTPGAAGNRRVQCQNLLLLTNILRTKVQIQGYARAVTAERTI